MKDNWDKKWSEYMETRLNEYQPAVPENLWNRLEDNLNLSQVAKIGLYKIIGGITLGVGMIMAGYFLFIKTDESDKIDSELNIGIHEQTDESKSIFERAETNKQINNVANDGSVSNKREKHIQTGKEMMKDQTIGRSFSSAEKDAIFGSENNNQNIASQLTTKKTDLHESMFHQAELCDESNVYARVLPYAEVKHERLSADLADISLRPSTYVHTNRYNGKIKTKLYYTLGGGAQFVYSWDVFLNPSIEYRVNKFGFYGGILYSINNIREITSGEGANNSTVNVLTNSIIQHRLSLMVGTNYSLWQSSKHQLMLNVGVISKSVALNGKGGSNLPLLLNTGVEFRLPVLKKYQTGIYYSYLHTVSKESKSGHSIGVKLLLGGKKK